MANAKKAWMSGQARMEELLAKAVIIDTVVFARKLTFGQGRRVAGARRVFPLCCKINACKQCRQRVEVGLNHHRQAMVRRRCWPLRQSALRKLICESREKKLSGSKVKEETTVEFFIVKRMKHWK